MSKTKKIWVVLFVSLIVIASSATFIFSTSINATRTPYQPPNTEIDSKPWKEIMDSNRLIDEFKVLNTGSVKVPLEGMLNTEKLGEDDKLKDYLWVDVFTFLFPHREKGWFMIDSGLDSTFQGNGNIKGILADNYIIASKQRKGQNTASQLRREGKKLKGIFLPIYVEIIRLACPNLIP